MKWIIFGFFIFMSILTVVWYLSSQPSKSALKSYSTINFSSTPTSVPQTINNVQYIDTDPVIDCTIGTKCGTVKLKKSECSQYSVCCEVGDQHVIKHSISECQSEQDAYDSRTRPQVKQGNTDPATTTTSTDSSQYWFCMESARKYYNSSFQQCSDGPDSLRASCYGSAQQSFTQNKSGCETYPH